MKTFKTLYDEALALHKQYYATNNLPALRDEVLPLYDNLLNQNPNEAGILFSVATVELQLGNNGKAINMLKRCIDLAGDAPEFYNNLGSAWKNEHDTVKARDCFIKAMQLRPCSEYANNMATTYINEGNPKEGLRWAKDALNQDQKNVKAHWNFSLLLLEDGEHDAGFAEYDAGLLSGDRPNRQFGGVPAYDGEDLKGKTVVVYGEQGVGDELLYASAIRDVMDAGAVVIYECHDRMENLMKRSFPDAIVYGTRKEMNDCPEWVKDHEIDYRIASGSLFRWFGVKKRDPYLVPDPDLVTKYQNMLALTADAGKPRVGIAYSGGVKKTHGHERTFKLTPLRPLLEQDMHWVSLQYSEGAKEKFHNYKRDTGTRVYHFGSITESHDSLGDKNPGWDYDHTVALIACLDLVIVPNTAAVHVCGALGKDCWTLTPRKCAWRYLGEENHMCWYQDHVTLYREAYDGYGTTIERMAEDLRQRYGKVDWRKHDV